LEQNRRSVVHTVFAVHHFYQRTIGVVITKRQHLQRPSVDELLVKKKKELNDNRLDKWDRS